MYNELQDSLKNVEMFMKALLVIKPKEKEVELLKSWNELMEPFRVEAKRIHYELIYCLQRSYNDKE